MSKPKFKVKSVKPEKDIQQQQQKQVVYFRLRRPVTQQQPQPQLIVNRFPQKRYQSSLPQNPQPSQNKQKVQQKLQQQANQLSKLFSNVNIANDVQYFLTRVKDVERLSKQQLDKADQLSKQTRTKNREQYFSKSRGIQNVKIMEIQQNDYVQLGGRKVSVQNLVQTNDYYYVLHKRNKVKEGTTISLPVQSDYLFDKIQFQEEMSDKGEEIEDDDEDSNRQSNPDYDYPEQDYQNSDSDDQGVINRDYYNGRSESDRGSQSPPQLDQQELYRKYLRDCKKDRNKIDSDDDEYY